MRHTKRPPTAKAKKLPLSVERLAYSRAEAAKMLGVDPSSILRWERNGTIRAARVGGRVLISAREISRLLDGDAG